MTETAFDTDVAQIVRLIRSRRRKSGRSIFAIAGPPASGKSTVAEAVVTTLNAARPSTPPLAALLPMDGYHLDNLLLKDRGLLSRKGAPETFDARGFCDALQALTSATHEVFFPTFDRQRDIAIANAIAIDPKTPIVVVEGNYLLLVEDPWQTLEDIFSATVFMAPPLRVLRSRLIARWIGHGLDAEAALERAEINDLPNAEVVLGRSRTADLVVGRDANK